MAEWDRKALLSLVDAAGASLNAPDVSVAQQHSLRALLEQYSLRAKSVNATPSDVLSMEAELSRILGTGSSGP